MMKRIIFILTFLWLITFPLRNSVFSFSIGEAKIYPNLIVTAFLVLLLIPSFFRFSKWQKGITLFLLSWVMYAFVFLWINGFTKEGVFDLHSLTMQFCVSFIFFGLLNVFGFEKLKVLLRDGLRFYLALIVVFGLFEIISTSHILLGNVSDLSRMPLRMDFWAPTFIYGNVNDYCMHLILSISLLYLVDDYLQKHVYLMLLLIVFVYFDSLLASSRLGEYIAYVYFVFFVGLYLFSKWQQYLNKKTLFYVSAMLVCLTALFVQNTFFDGRAYLKMPESILNASIIFDSEQNEGTYFRYLDEKTKEKYKAMKIVLPIFTVDDVQTNSSNSKIPVAPLFNHHADTSASADTLVWERESMKNKSSVHTNTLHSTLPRINLLRNGLDMIKEQPIVGNGPGSFILAHKEQRFQRETSYITTPHNFVIEILSQFGIWAWCYLAVLTYFFFRIIFKKYLPISAERKRFVLLFLLLYPFIGAMSSSFLYINLHWFLLPMLVILLLPQIKDGACAR